MFANSLKPAGRSAAHQRTFPHIGETWTPTMRFVAVTVLAAILALMLASIAGGV